MGTECRNPPAVPPARATVTEYHRSTHRRQTLLRIGAYVNLSLVLSASVTADCLPACRCGTYGRTWQYPTAGLRTEYLCATHCRQQPPLHCTQRCAALHCTQRCAALHCTQHCAALRCAALRCTALYCAAPHCTALHCTALRCTALHCAAQCSAVQLGFTRALAVDSRSE